MDLSEGLCLGTASLKRDTAFVRLRKPYSDSAELVEALVHAGVVSRIGPSTLRVPAVVLVLVLVLGGPGGCRLCRTGLSLSLAQGKGSDVRGQPAARRRESLVRARVRSCAPSTPWPPPPASVVCAGHSTFSH